LGTTPAGFRYYLYTAHYRSELNLSSDALRSAESARRRLAALARAADAVPSDAPPKSESLRKLRRRFFDALYDDLNAPRALSAMWEIADQPEPLAERARLVKELAQTLGLDLSDAVHSGPDDAWIEQLVEKRERARRAGDYALSDALRADLAARGVVVEDRASGSRWRRA
jgi:cysteinyl-tRNA synthetase